MHNKLLVDTVEKSVLRFWIGQSFSYWLDTIMQFEVVWSLRGCQCHGLYLHEQVYEILEISDHKC